MIFAFISEAIFIILMYSFLATAKVALLVFAIIIGIIAAIICAGVASSIADKKGYPPTAWGFLGLFIGFAGCFIACLLPDLNKLMGRTVVVENNRTSNMWQGLKQKAVQLKDRYAERKWTCTCGQVNNGRATACIKCGKAKGDKTKSFDWVCEFCGEINEGGSFCRSCGKYKTHKAQVQQSSPKSLSKWTCECGQENNDSATACINCGKGKVVDKKSVVESSKPSTASKAGDKANISRSESVVKKDVALMSYKHSDIWFCKCGQPNLENQENCVQCNSSKYDSAVEKHGNIKLWKCSCGQPNNFVAIRCRNCGEKRPS